MASGISTIFLPFDPDEICDRLILFLQEKGTGDKSDIINRKKFSIVDKLLRIQMHIYETT